MIDFLFPAKFYHSVKFISFFCHNTCYTCIGEYTRLCAEKIDDRIVITESTEKKMRWVFSDITDSSFHWQNWMLEENDEWAVRCDCLAARSRAVS